MAAVPTEKILRGLAASRDDPRPPVVLVSCGSFSPVTLMHMRLFETARNHLSLRAGAPLSVVGGLLSPVHQAYGKRGLAPAQDRLAMCRLAAEGSAWIEASGWEVAQDGWTRTARVLAEVEEAVERARDAAGGGKRATRRPPVRALLLCGADLLESALNPAVWDPALVRTIFGEHGVACLERAGADAAALVSGSPLLSEFRANIHIVPRRIENNISSTAVRELLAQGLSARYLVPERVAGYLEARPELFGGATRTPASPL